MSDYPKMQYSIVPFDPPMEEGVSGSHALMSPLIFHIESPLTINNTKTPVVRKRRGGKRYANIITTTAGRAYRSKVKKSAREALEQSSFTWSRETPWVRLTVLVTWPDMRRRDLDGILKPLQDGMEAQLKEEWPEFDDNFILDVRVTRCANVKGESYLWAILENVPEGLPEIGANEMAYKLYGKANNNE